MSSFRSDFHLDLAILLILVFMLPLSLNSNQTGDFVTNISDSPIKDNELSYTTSSAINFTNNDDFTLQGFPGSGSAEDPYRIENLSIRADGDCIKVVNTTAHFTISGCFLASNTTDSGSGVYLYNVSNCRITNCFIEYKNYGCTLQRFTTNCVISENQIRYCDDSGIYSVCAFYCTITENIITDCRIALELIGGGGYSPPTSFFNISYNTLRYNSWGIDMNAADSCIIDHNIIEDGNTAIHGFLYNITITNNQIDTMSHGGINVGYDSYGLLQGNTISNVDGTGIHINFYAGNLSISHNEIEKCGTGIYCQGSNILFEWNNISYHTRGVEIQNSKDCIFRNNLVSENDWYGLDVSGYTDNNSFYYNSFIDNAGPNARDRGGNNTWDDGASRGNMWDDYIGFGSYVIPDRNLGADRYPDNPEHGLQYNVILPPIGIGIICVVGIILLYRRRDLIRARLKQS